ncbi:MAG: restriction endonuclease subunit S [Candidatus Cloacimonetes bacterium]|nr:restriction endonuclease subunit S [Candidatus Cloacimonadota bacterium]
MSLQPYPEYKNVGLDWIASIPKHWLAKPNRALFAESNITKRDNEKLLSVTISRGIITQEELLNSSSKKDSSNLNKSKYKLVEPNDIAYNKMRAWQGAIGVSKYKGIVSPAYIIHKPKINICPDYYHYLFRSSSMIKVFEKWSYGITSDQWSLRPEHFRLISNILPPYEEQEQIARYLDYKNHLINKYIRIKKKQIELLKELKQAIINDAVTGKIDVRTGKPYPKYKDSGVDWLGMIPEEWIALPLKWSIRIASGEGKTNAEIHQDRTDKYQYQVIGGNGLMGYTDEFNSTRNQIIIGRVGALCGNIHLLDESSWVTDNALRITKLNGYDSEYLSHQLRCMNLNRLSNANAQPLVTGSIVKSQRVVSPPVPVQRAIVSYIHSINSTFGAKMLNLVEGIDYLKELQTRLISDVVTGKLDVREVEIPDFEEENEVLDDEVIDESIIEDNEYVRD